MLLFEKYTFTLSLKTILFALFVGMLRFVYYYNGPTFDRLGNERNLLLALKPERSTQRDATEYGRC